MRVDNPVFAFERFGYMVGRMARLSLYSKHSMIRWSSRVIIFSLFLSWFVGAIMGIASFGLIMLVAAKVDFLVLKGIADDKSDNVPNGRNVFGRKLDSWGQVEGDLSVDDPFSSENINNPQYLHGAYFSWSADDK